MNFSGVEKGGAVIDERGQPSRNRQVCNSSIRVFRTLEKRIIIPGLIRGQQCRTLSLQLAPPPAGVDPLG